MSMSQCCSDELRAVKERFTVLTKHWLLDSAEAAALIGLPTPHVGGDPLAEPLGQDVETRLRLAIEVAGELDRALPPGVLLEWLRDDEDDNEAPLAFMSRGVLQLRAMRAAAVARSS